MKIKKEVTYNGKICEFEKKIGKLSFYTYLRDAEDEDSITLLVVDDKDEVLASISTDHSYGEYGLIFNGYLIEKE